MTGTRTVPIYMVRHAKAGSRKRWAGPDNLRPLSRAGREQAAALVALFSEVPLASLVSSPYVRCVQTFEPLAQARRIPLETSDALAEGASADGVLSLAFESARIGPTGLCTHGDVIEWLLEELAERDVPLESRGGIELKKGSVWILPVRDGQIVSAEYVPPHDAEGR